MRSYFIGLKKEKTIDENKKVHLFKTEMCRSFEETGHCRYSDRCHFAHNIDELREVRRHPRYKTEICKVP
jgi:hypothetical protein